MTKSATEKKKLRRGSTQNGSKVASQSSSSKKREKQKDVFRLFADKVRDHKQLKSRWAVMQETRVEYFRGKDFVAFLANHPEVKQSLGPNKDMEAEDIANVLLRKQLLLRCDRVVKTLRPGKKKLSSWPAHLEVHPDQAFSENDSFFAWIYEKRVKLWQAILSYIWPLFALAICLFPVYPYQCKIVVLYFCAGALMFIMTMLVLRAMVFGALWILLGKRIWFFPNINAEETTFTELVQFWPKVDEGDPISWSSRLIYGIVGIGAILLLRHHAPDEAARARYQQRVSNIIDDVLEWSPRLSLSSIMESQPMANVSESNHSTGDGRTADAEKPFADAGMEPDIDLSDPDIEDIPGNDSDVQENQFEEKTET